MALVAEAAFEIVGDRDRVVAVGEALETAAQEDPGATDSQHFTEYHPECLHSDCGSHAGETEEKPG